MPNKDIKLPENATGRYYVDNTCIDCDLCRQAAPKNFTRNENEGHSYVMKQPENEEEERQCNEAKAACPVESIGDDAT